MRDECTPDYHALAARIRTWARELGFQQAGICGVDLAADEERLLEWLAAGRHGEMHYMARHGARRSRPAELVHGATRIISLRMDYRPPAARDTLEVLAEPSAAFISRYALGRDYHRLVRGRLRRLAALINEDAGPRVCRPFVDSAPVLEKALARNAELGWIGKHTNLINPRAGSWFFLGELYTDLPLPVDEAYPRDHCGSCTACLEICPTRAIIAPYQLDARRCISYLTIELRGPIPEEFRPLIGNRIFGCDDCQLVCPWNRFSRPTGEAEFAPRHDLDRARLVDLFRWSREEFLRRTEGSALRRTGYDGWLRNIAVALGNAPPAAFIRQVLQERRGQVSEMVREHIDWALRRQK